MSHFRPLARLALPLILTSSAVTIMQIIDAAVLARYSADAVAAMGSGGMAVLLLQSLITGTTCYTSVFCAHALGARQRARIFRSAWQGIHLALLSGLFFALIAWPAGTLFRHVGHPAAVATDEVIYFRWLTLGTVLPALGSALAGWLSGQGRTRILTAVQVSGFVVNGILAWGLVLGEWGLPQLGMRGAAFATLSGQAVTTLILAALFVHDGGFHRAAFRAVNPAALHHFLALALPQGLRITAEVLVWTAFLFFIGRLGTLELAACTIAFRINGMAFFPLTGLGQAAGILTGQARGSRRDRRIPGINRDALLVGEGWMLLFVVIFLVAPRPLMAIFTGSESGPLVDLGVHLLRYVALYSILDAVNVIVASVLSAAGDTRWILWFFMGLCSTFMVCMITADHLHANVDTYWIMATVYSFITAATWLLRFRTGAWKRCQVLRSEAPDQAA